MHLRFTAILLSGLLSITTIPACKKSNVKPAPAPPALVSSSRTSGMGGVRNWHGSHSYDASGMHYPTPVHQFYNYADTSFAVTVVDDTTIVFMGANYKYSRTDTPNHIYFFGTAYYFYEYGMGTGVAYFYSKDSIVFCNGDRHATSDQWTLKDLRYTY